MKAASLSPYSKPRPRPHGNGRKQANQEPHSSLSSSCSYSLLVSTYALCLLALGETPPLRKAKWRFLCRGGVYPLPRQGLPSSALPRCPRPRPPPPPTRPPKPNLKNTRFTGYFDYFFYFRIYECKILIIWSTFLDTS